MIEGKVIEIYNDKELAIDVGSDAGVREGMLFRVFINGKEVRDPVSKKSLGFIELVKGNLKVVNVSAKFAVAKATPLVVGTEFVPSGMLSSLSGLAGGFTKEITEETKLDAPPKAERVSLIPPDKIIHVGDRVRSYT